MPHDREPLERLKTSKRIEAALAVAPALAATIGASVDAPVLTGIYTAFALPLAIPLLPRTRRTFSIVCLVVAGIYIPLSIVVFYLIFLLPSALVLLSLGLAARGPGRRLACRVTAWTIAIAMMIPMGLALQSY